MEIERAVQSIDPMRSGLDQERLPLPDGAQVETYRLEGPLAQYKDVLNKAAQQFSLADRPTFPVEKVPQYVATVIAPEKSSEADVGFVFLPGMLGTSFGAAHMALNLYNQAQEKELSVGLSAALSSSASFDVKDQPFPLDPVERGAYQAVCIAELLEKHTCKNLILVGHSLGGMEAPYIVPFLQKLLKEKKLQTEIGGMILFQAGGQVDGSIHTFPSRVGKFLSHEDELRDLFPSPLDEMRASEKVFLAKEKGDMSEELRRTRELEEIRSKRQKPLQSLIDEMSALEKVSLAEEKGDTSEVLRRRRELEEIRSERQKLPQSLTLQEWRILKNIDQALEDVWYRQDHSQVQELLDRRRQFLLPVFNKLVQGAEAREVDHPKVTLNAGKTVIKPFAGVMRSTPDAVRELIRGIPVAVVWSESDVYFPTAEVVKKQKPDPFPYASALFEASIGGSWAHVSLGADPAKFANIITSITQRMRDVPKGNKPEEKIRLRLYY